MATSSAQRKDYAVLAAQAMDLIDRLVAGHGLSVPGKPDYYRQREGFVRALQDWGKQAKHADRASCG